MPMTLHLRSSAFFLLVLLLLPSVCDVTTLKPREDSIEKMPEKELEREREEDGEEGGERGQPWNTRPIIGILAQELHSDLLEGVLGQIERAVTTSLENSYPQPLDTATNPDEVFLGGGGGGDSHQTLYSHLLPPAQLDPNRFSQRGNDVYSIIPLTTEPVSKPSRKFLGNSVDQFLKSEGTEYHRWENEEDTEPPPKKNLSYIAASYVKFVESGGARVVPIMINKDEEYYEKMFNSLNGVLFPGGAVAVDETSGYGRAGKLIYEKARASSLAGDPFPLWGTCLGFELLMFLAAGSTELRTRCQAQNLASTTQGTRAIKHSRLWRNMPHHLRHTMATKPLAANFHYYCVTPENFTNFGVNSDFELLATNFDAEGLEYVAIAEGVHDLPFFAVQFHPEKNLFEWTTLENHNSIPHTSDAAAFASYFARFFVDQARWSHHNFSSPEEEEAALVYNFVPVATPKSPFEQIYVFPLDSR